MSGGGTGRMSGGGESTTSGTPMGCGLEGCSIIPSLSATSRPIAERGPRPAPYAVRYWYGPSIHMLAPLFHHWERRLASAATDRLRSPVPVGSRLGSPQWSSDGRAARASSWSTTSRRCSATLMRSIRPRRRTAYDLRPPDGTEPARLTFPSALVTPHPENNVVHARYFPARTSRQGGRSRRAVLVLAQWNSDAAGHVGLARMLARFGMSALRLSLPYHDWRMPSGAHARRLHRQRERRAYAAGLPPGGARCATRDLAGCGDQGYERIGILGTSLGSCLAMLTAAHEPLVRAQALNHISPHFADVVWRGLSTRHVREGLEGTCHARRRCGGCGRRSARGTYLDRIHAVPHAARVRTVRPDVPGGPLTHAGRASSGSAGIAHELNVLPCGHYSTGTTPFKYLDGYVLTKFLHAQPVSPCGALAGGAGDCEGRTGRAQVRPGRPSGCEVVRDTSAAQPARCRGRLPVP